jgi:CBS domain-containing protein
MIRAGPLLKSKGHNVGSIDPEATVYDTIKMMAEKRAVAQLGFIVGCIAAP